MQTKTKPPHDLFQLFPFDNALIKFEQPGQEGNLRKSTAPEEKGAKMLFNVQKIAVKIFYYRSARGEERREKNQ